MPASAARQKRRSLIMPAFIPNAEPIPINSSTPKTQWVTVTPALATKWLDESNANNRTLRMSHIAAMAVDMAAGKWKGKNAEPIKFDTNGRMFEGQHRCYACIEADTPFETLLVTGCDPEAYATSGIGKSKQLADFLWPVDGEKNVHLLAAAVRLVWAWQNGSLASAKSAVATMTELRETYKNNPKLPNSVNAMMDLKGLKELRISHAHCALVHYAASMNKEHAQVEAFLERLASGLRLTESDPVYQLRKFLLSQPNKPGLSKAAAGKMVKLALLIKAWNLSKEGKRTTSLRFRQDEEFPEL